MFGGIARRYDFLNRLLSVGRDRSWRRRAAKACAVALCSSRGREPAGIHARDEPHSPASIPATLRQAQGRPLRSRLEEVIVLDLCCGTGDLAMAVARRMPEAHVIACDFARPMLALARRKFAEAGLSGRAAILEADALALPLPDASVDAITCAFGLRNLADPCRGLAEMLRVLRPGGAAVILEFHPPPGRGLLAGAFRLYFRRILPTLGAWISGSRHGGYRYLVASVEAFSAPEATAAAIGRAGFESVRIEPLTAGVVSLFVGRKPA
jgi:demethylmenaquinone methyltransferase/2-methoxy-6-polyprenyl-1,4-benzoquinol methylase